MSETWKIAICESPQCVSEMFISENMKAADNSLTRETLEKYKILPDIDNEVMLQFTCPRCGTVQTWGVTRRDIQQSLYERYNK